MTAYIREPVNGLTHLAGALLSFAALLAMVVRVAVGGFQPIELTAVIIFGLSLIALYASSATYHMVLARDRIIAFLRRLDHSMIYVLIAGTYTPFCLISLQGAVGWSLFSLVSAMAVAGVIFKLIWFHSPRWISTALYIGMGWLIIFFIAPLSSVLAFEGIALLIAGGILYTIGGVIYGFKPRWMISKHIGYHEVFHVFILLGSLAHFLSVYLYVI